MNLFPLSMYKGNSALQNFLRENTKFKNMKERRKLARIAVVDDEPFEAEQNLKSYGYEITQIGDIKNIEEVKEFPIVLCDLMGVGNHFDRDSQGASLIREIKKNYPSIIVVAYTGARLSSVPVKTARNYADEMLKKDATIDDWSDLLDRLVDKAIDPFYIWERTRKTLVASGVETKYILILEDAYVRSVINKDEEFTKLQKLVESPQFGGDIRNIINGLVASLLFRALFGV